MTIMVQPFFPLELIEVYLSLKTDLSSQEDISLSICLANDEVHIPVNESFVNMFKIYANDYAHVSRLSMISLK